MDSKCKSIKKRQDESDSESESESAYKKECVKYKKKKQYSSKCEKENKYEKQYSSKCEKENKCKCEEDVFVKFEIKTLLKSGVNIIKLKFEKV